jgi:hypothetical protein
MSMKDGGPASPGKVRVEYGNGQWDLENSEGMTLRDYFAAKELTNMRGNIAVCDIPSAYERIADHCYRMADAMIAARETK